MSVSLDHSPAENGDQEVNDRRRPGRLENVNPELIPLMRGEFPPDDAGNDLGSAGLRPARGIAVGIILVLPLWALILAGAYWLFH